MKGTDHSTFLARIAWIGTKYDIICRTRIELMEIHVEAFVIDRLTPEIMPGPLPERTLTTFHMFTP
jgi:hypothetical protein